MRKKMGVSLFIFLGIFGCEAEEATVITSYQAMPDLGDADITDTTDTVIAEEDAAIGLDTEVSTSEPEDAVETPDTSSEDESQEPEDAGPPPECIDASNCNDLNSCTTDTCTEGVCVHDEIPGCCLKDEDCDDGVSCTQDSCNVFTNECAHQPEDTLCCQSAEDCDDGDPCSADICIGNQCIHPKESGPDCGCQADLLCDDDNPCTADTCSLGTCVSTPIEGEGCCSNDGCPWVEDKLSLCVFDLCWNGEKACESSEDCVPPTPCWMGSCSEGGCSYSQAPNCCELDSQCDDGQDATADQCVENICVNSLGESQPCTDDNECVSDNPCALSTCSDAGVCTTEAVGAPGCCQKAFECPSPEAKCTQALCVNFSCQEGPLTGFQPFITSDFDDGTLQGWTEESNGAGAFWHLSGANNLSGEFSLYFGKDGVPNYDVGVAQGSTTSPSYPSTLDNPIVLRFDRIAHVEPITSRDKFWLEVVQGSSITEIWDKGYDNGPGLGWKSVELDITSYLQSGNFQLRFSFDSIDGTKNEYEGLYVDNVSIGSLCE